jgi:hypothetical protein
MTRPLVLFAAAALIPAMTAPSEGLAQVSPVSALIVALCGGGSMVLPVGNGAPAPQPCCCAKGCRPESQRRRTKRKE